MQANSAVSPMKMPIRPDSASRPKAAVSRLRQPPPASASAQSSAAANSMRQRLKAKAPRRCDAGAENSAATAQQVAAASASASGLGMGSAPGRRAACAAGRPPRQAATRAAWACAAAQLPATFMRLMSTEPTVLAP